MIQTSVSLHHELRHAARYWREWAGDDALAKTVTRVFNQSAFRGRNDDGDEAAATWKANENTNWTQNVDENFRVRIQVEETATGTTGGDTPQLQYNLNSAGWVNVTGSSSVVRSSASPNVADGTSLNTQRLTTSTRAYQTGTGTFDEVDGAGTAAILVALSNECSEWEFCVQIRSADVFDGDIVQLRLSSTGVALDTYTNTPSITVNEEAAALTEGEMMAARQHGTSVPVFAKPQIISYSRLVRI